MSRNWHIGWSARAICWYKLKEDDCGNKSKKAYDVVVNGRDGRREADRKFGFIHPCVTYPLDDMEIDVPVAY